MADLTSDLIAAKSFIATMIPCTQQRPNLGGWWSADCIERKSTPKCERCKILQRLEYQIKEHIG
jgi:hypothetical protein